MIKKTLLFWLVFVCGANLLFATELEQVQEAETAVLSGTTSLVSNANASGGSFIKLETIAPKGALELQLSNVTGGLHKLEVFSFNGGTPVDIEMSINGATATTISLDPSNWAYQGTAKVTIIDVNLSNGVNTIELTALSTNALIDKLVVREDYDIYYVSAAGNDANDGSFNTPWKTLDKASAAAINPTDL